jgi:hypothetical protein
MRSSQTDNGRRFGRPAVIAGIGLAAVTLGLVLALMRWPQEAAPPPPVASPATPAPTSPGTAITLVPSFDVARISRDGDAVIAGRAAPGATVVIMGNGKPLGSVSADERGEWVFVPEAPLPPGAHRLTLSMQRPPGEAALVGDGEVLVIVPDSGKDIAGRGGQATSRPLALLVPGSGDRAPTVLQKPGSGEAAAGLAIDIVDYDSDGRLAIAGRAAPNAQVRIMLDGRPLGSASADATGSWSLTKRQVKLTGSHLLEAEEIDARGNVGSRFSGRLQLAPQATVASADGKVPGGSIVIEPGQNLWRIARRTYGQGYAYTIIFDANRAHIGDPDLIYPGQVFVLPPTPEASAN